MACINLNLNLDLVKCFEGCITIFPKKRLKRKMEELKKMKSAINDIIDKQKREKQATECKDDVTNWLKKVEEKENEVNRMCDSLAQRCGCTFCCCTNNRENVDELIRTINDFVESGRQYLARDELLVKVPPICPKRELERKKDRLERMRKDITASMEEKLRLHPEMEPAALVKNWLHEVDRKVEKVNPFLLGQRCNPTCGCTPRDRETVRDLINDIDDSLEDGKGHLARGQFVSQSVREPIDNIPDLGNVKLVGRTEKLSEIDGFLRDSQVKTIGIWGPGGIGKTTLLKSITPSHEFRFVIWIEMYRNFDIWEIQKKIALCIDLELKEEDETYGRAATKLKAVLRRNNSLILMDNVWDKLDFEKIGIPISEDNNNIKIVFTTRSRRICYEMAAKKTVQLDYLHEEESRELFKNNVHPPVLDLINQHQIISQHVDAIIKKCGGLPLVICVIASATADYDRVEQWETAVNRITKSPTNIEGMDEVINRLSFSYDMLENDEIKSCLLHFSLYPEGWIEAEEVVIRKWLAEGFLDDVNSSSYRESYSKGLDFMNKLKSFCLVEFEGTRVKVHDVIREMLVWIREKKKGEICLIYKDGDNNDSYNRWDSAKGIYLNERQLKRLPSTGMPSCPNLTSLIVERRSSDRIVEFPTQDFFNYTESLQILDLSRTGLEFIPDSIGKLVELRYLGLSCTRIKIVPKQLGNLKKLRWLDLASTRQLESIEEGCISQLSRLQSLTLFVSSYRWDLKLLQDLDQLTNLEELGLDVHSISHLNTILGKRRLSESITSMGLENIRFTKELQLQLTTQFISESLPHLKELSVYECALPDGILEIEGNYQLALEHLNLCSLKISSVIMNDRCCPLRNLTFLHLTFCHRLKEVSWTARLPSLLYLFVKHCNGIEDLLVEEIEEDSGCYFSKLVGLVIEDLEKLRRIRGRNLPLRFPCLKRLIMSRCPNLTQLSLGHDSAKAIKVIECEQHQWDSLEWPNDEVQSRFLRYFRASEIFDLDRLTNLEEGSMDVPSNSHLNAMLREGWKLTGSITRINFINICFTEELQLTTAQFISKSSLRNLKHLDLSNCGNLKEVSWTARLPSLQHLFITRCHGIEELLVEEEEQEQEETEIEEDSACYFSKLASLEIKELRNLRSIRGKNLPLRFPSLIYLKIIGCPNLRQLSLGHDSARHIEGIECEQRQWDSLEWPNDEVQSRFLRYFRASEILDLDELSNLEERSMDIRSNSHLYAILWEWWKLPGSITIINLLDICFTEELQLTTAQFISESSQLKELTVLDCALPHDILEIEGNFEFALERLNL